SSDRTSSPAFVRDGLYILDDVRRIAVNRDQIVGISLLTRDGAHIRFAKVGRRFGERIEHGLQIEGRAADDLEHVGGGGLLLQRFREIVGALAQFVKQSRVFNSNDCLGGEGLEQCNLLVGKRYIFSEKEYVAVGSPHHFSKVRLSATQALIERALLPLL